MERRGGKTHKAKGEEAKKHASRCLLFYCPSWRQAELSLQGRSAFQQTIGLGSTHPLTTWLQAEEICRHCLRGRWQCSFSMMWGREEASGLQGSKLGSSLSLRKGWSQVAPGPSNTERAPRGSFRGLCPLLWPPREAANSSELSTALCTAH